MRPSLIAEHREIEAALGPLAQSSDLELFRAAHRLCVRHYEHEEEFLIRLAARDPALAAKLRGQHAEALELAAGVEESLAAGRTSDVAYLARRFVAIVQHNIIEEERDVFPLRLDG